MPLATIISLLMPLVTHLIDKLMAKDTTTMSESELAEHTANVAHATAMSEHAAAMKV